MAVQARYLTHDFPTVGGSMSPDEYGGCVPAAAGFVDTTVLGDFPRSELTCSYGFAPRKRPRVAPAEAGCFLEDQRVVLPPPVAQGLAAVPQPASDVQSRAVGSGVASTSGRLANGAIVSQSQGLMARVYHQGVEVDAVVTLESERMRAGLQDSRRRHARALLAAAERAASGRLRAANAELERALRRNAELEEKARQVGAECQAWAGVARSHEAVAAGLRATLDQLLQQRAAACAAAAAEGDAEDAQSCCFEAAPSSSRKASLSSCKACGGGEACVLLLPCRHLCLCRACEAAAEACPVCAAAKNASLHVLRC
ncbi:hypothetical protein ACP70R_009605 [Stipagrostis hirtigluma subsp. patula]